MLIATRILRLHRKDSEIEIPIRVFAPETMAENWICRIEIGWPDGMTKMEVGGVDAVQSLYLALQVIGAQIYASDHHASGQLLWLEPGRGYGFPVPSAIKDMLEGDDRQ